MSSSAFVSLQYPPVLLLVVSCLHCLFLLNIVSDLCKVEICSFHTQHMVWTDQDFSLNVKKYILEGLKCKNFKNLK